MTDYDSWQSPLSERYASKEMLNLFSPRTRIHTWRLLWLWLAEAEKELGKTEINDKAIAQLKDHVYPTNEDFQIAAVEEKRRRHDVMAHVHAYGQVAPEAAGIIHLGTTSCYVTDNADLIFLRDGLNILLPKLATVIHKLSDFARVWKSEPCLAYTHGQSAIPTTVGKRVTLWIQDLLMDLCDLERAKVDLRFRGVKGTTGTQGSFLTIFDNDHAKVEKLDELVTKKAGFESAYIITSQTYSRKIDVRVINALSSFGATCERIGGDIRHLAMLKELSEPMEKDQIGSSAMAFKSNPMRSERMCSLGRNLSNRSNDATHTYAAQWFERTLDDSAIRRMYIPESFLCADAILILLDNVCSGLAPHPKVIHKRLMHELPYIATENIIMHAVAKGVSRQAAHEKIRLYSRDAASSVREGGENNLIELIKNEKLFVDIRGELSQILAPSNFIGRAPQQVEKFTGPGGEVEAALEKYRDRIGTRQAELKV